MKAFKTKTALVILGSLILVTTASVALAKYKYSERNSHNEFQTVKTEAPELEREVQAGSNPEVTSVKPVAAEWTYEEQAAYLNENKRVRNQMLQEAENR